MTWAEYLAGPECLAARTAAATEPVMTAIDEAAMVATATDAMEVETGAPAHGEGSSAMEVEAGEATTTTKKSMRKRKSKKSSSQRRLAAKQRERVDARRTT